MGPPKLPSLAHFQLDVKKQFECPDKNTKMHLIVGKWQKLRNETSVTAEFTWSKDGRIKQERCIAALSTVAISRDQPTGDSLEIDITDIKPAGWFAGRNVSVPRSKRRELQKQCRKKSDWQMIF